MKWPRDWEARLSRNPLPNGESQSNGAVEEAGKAIREMAKVLKDSIEDKLMAKAKIDFPEKNLVCSLFQ